MGPGSAFPTNVNQEDIDKLQLISKCKLPPEVSYNNRQKTTGNESWSVAWGPDQTYIAWPCGRRHIKLLPWNPARNCSLVEDDRDLRGKPLANHPRVLRTIDAGDYVHSVAFGSKSTGRRTSVNDSTSSWFRFKVPPDDLILAAGLRNGRIRTWVVKTGVAFLVLMDHTKPVRDLKFAPDGSHRVLSASQDGTLKLWHLDDDGNMSKTFKAPGTFDMEHCAWAPDCSMVVGVGDGRSVNIWDMATFKSRQLRGHLNEILGCEFSPDGAVLATASLDTSVILWDPHTGEILTKLRHLLPEPRAWMVGGANDSYVRAVTFNREGRHVATICDDGFLRIWDLLQPEAPVAIAEIDKASALCCRFSPDGAVIAVGSEDSSLSLWKAYGNRFNLQHQSRVAVRRYTLPVIGQGEEVGGANPANSAALNCADSAVFNLLPSDIRKFLRYEDLLLAN